MSIDGGVPGCSSQIFTLSIWNVFPFLLDVSLGESEIQQEDLVGSLIETDAEVVGFYVTMEEVSAVDVLNSLDHLVDEHENALK